MIKLGKNLYDFWTIFFCPILYRNLKKKKSTILKCSNFIFSYLFKFHIIYMWKSVTILMHNTILWKMLYKQYITLTIQSLANSTVKREHFQHFAKYWMFVRNFTLEPLQHHYVTFLACFLWYVPQGFKSAVVTLLLIKLTVCPEVVVNYRLILLLFLKSWKKLKTVSVRISTPQDHFAFSMQVYLLYPTLQGLHLEPEPLSFQAPLLWNHFNR